MTEPAFVPLVNPPSQSATEQVFDAIYNAVISLKLPPGTKVSEAEIAKQMQVSRQPVRDAFFRLSELGFLAIRPQRATLITPISQEAVLNAIFIRTAIEAECLRVAIERLTEEDLAKLKRNIAEQEIAVRQTDAERFHALDESLHKTLCEIAGQRNAWALILEQKAHMDRVRFLTLSAERQRMVFGQHVEIINAIEARDTELALKCLRAHIANLKGVLDKIRAKHPSYFEGST